MTSKDHSNNHDILENLNNEEFSAVEHFPISFSIFALARSHKGLAAQLIRDTGLFPGQEIMLMQLYAHDHQSQNSLGRTLRLDHSTVAKSVRRLEDAGLVTRSRSKLDGRVTIVSLTEAGRALEDQVNAAWSQVEQITTAGLSDEEKNLLLSLTQKIAAQIDSSLS
ncbi:MarR family winged helix-turn-helix transcriptional regulator [Paenibacillus sp. UMB7766-LJ446]|jgi:DNA-binding MarR family transcriptional regulator|uniref:MarR family winged helix-turn-helix transcriptional regulator n=1 Tax=Paenibacillus TaxID=44249 RepID=UPI000BA09C5E|nr:MULTISPECIES: MarR family winged helix-turn-helix transcriptional regulator [Paenibacillus]MDK8191372.1 MarR family winged helix-turn-helix transcriptional regulator [Paenibacillus sp. UMB7766-LJ446]OZQ65239.1 MarR family transcriptional regulator [Paenibacillus taichungensis]HBU83898.1 MarR family transcriptional regulator [Paenibacillus sp.]